MIVILIVCSCSKWKYNTKSDFEHPNYTMCKLTSIVHYNTWYAVKYCGWYSYNVNGKSYIIVGPSYDYSRFDVVGLHYKIIYDSLHPENSHILHQEPTFLPNDKVVKAVGSVNKLYKHSIKYSYKDEFGKEFVKLKYMNQDYRANFPDLVVDGTYEVEYATGNHSISLIHLDKPVNKV